MREYYIAKDKEGVEATDNWMCPILFNNLDEIEEVVGKMTFQKVFLLTEEELDKVRKIADLDARIGVYRRCNIKNKYELEELENELKSLKNDGANFNNN